MPLTVNIKSAVDTDRDTPANEEHKAPLSPFSAMSDDDVALVTKRAPRVEKKDLGTQVSIEDGFFAIKTKGTFVLNPDSGPLKIWDLIIMILLGYTAIVTPFEVALLETEMNTLWGINRFVDFFFVVDMFKSFVTAITVDGMWVVSNSRLTKEYMHGWFIIDLASVLPVDSIGMMLGSDTSKFKILRIVRLFRLIKLLRLFRAAKILKRWEARMGISYGTLNLMKYALITLVVAHWLACVFRMIPELEVSEQNWLTRYYDVEEMSLGSSVAGIWDQYFTAFYWSWATITTIGYGDVVCHTVVEKGVGVISMCIGAGVYAYIVGGVCGVLANKDMATSKFYQLMDDMNRYMAEHGVPTEVRVKMRSFQINCRELTRQQQYHQAVDSLTPTLRGELMQHTSLRWIDKIAIFQLSPENERTGFMQSVAAHMAPRAYSETEVMLRQQDPLHHMLCIQQGLASKLIGDTLVKFLSKDAVIGEDLILFDKRRSMATVKAITFVLAYELRKDSFQKVLESWEFQGTRKAMRWELCRRVFQERFKIYAFTFREVNGKWDGKRAAGGEWDKAHQRTLQALDAKGAFNYHEFTAEDLEKSRVRSLKYGGGDDDDAPAAGPSAVAKKQDRKIVPVDYDVVKTGSAGPGPSVADDPLALGSLLEDFAAMSEKMRSQMDAMDRRIRQAIASQRELQRTRQPSVQLEEVQA